MSCLRSHTLLRLPVPLHVVCLQPVEQACRSLPPTWGRPARSSWTAVVVDGMGGELSVRADDDEDDELLVLVALVLDLELPEEERGIPGRHGVGA